MTLVIAHRGAHGRGAPENSLAAFERAIELGADMVELDVRMTADGELVVAHDAVHAAGYHQLVPRPPRLVEALDLCRGRIALDVEVKEPGYVPPVVAMLRAFPLRDCVLTSFHEEVIANAKALAPELRAGLVLDSAPPPEALERSGADFLVLARHLEPIPGCLTWTVNQPAELGRTLSHPDVVGVITDKPELALEIRTALSDRTAPAAPS